MAKIAHQKHRDETSATGEALDEAARTAGAAAVAETDQRAQPRSGEKLEVAATSVLEILSDQTRHSFEAATAVGRARNFSEVAQVQSDFIGGSFARMGRLNESALALLRSGMTSLPTRR